MTAIDPTRGRSHPRPAPVAQAATQAPTGRAWPRVAATATHALGRWPALIPPRVRGAFTHGAVGDVTMDSAGNFARPFQRDRHLIEFGGDDYTPDPDDDTAWVSDIGDPVHSYIAYNALSSRVRIPAHDEVADVEPLHSPIIDIDIPMQVVPSSTPGHHHLSFPTVVIPWSEYARLLDVLVDVGIIEAGYRDASVARQCTIVRAQGVERNGPRPTSMEAMAAAIATAVAPADNADPWWVSVDNT